MILDGKYLKWSTYDGDRETEINLVYLGAPYLSLISVTEHRNLVYNYRYLFSLNEKGENLAGIFSKIEEHALFLYVINEHNPRNTRRVKLRPELFNSMNVISFL